MLVLVSFGLVLLATILLVVGLLTDDGLNLIYLSIACSAAAAVVLYLAFRRAKPKTEVAATPPEPIMPEGVEPGELDEPVVAATAPTSARDATTVQPVVPAPESDRADAVNPGGTPTADTQRAVATDEVDDDVEAVPATTDDDWVSDDDWADGGDFEVEFPIADYDELTVDEIMPLLPQLYSDELEIVAERERATKNRPEVLARLEELAATGTDADALDEGDEDQLDDAVNPGGTPTADTEPAVGTEPVAAGGSARPVPEVPSLADDEWADDDDVPFPIADYDTLDADQVITLLAQLEEDELEDVKAREVAGPGRKSVLTEIDRLLGVAPDGIDDPWRSDDVAPAASTEAEVTSGLDAAIESETTIESEAPSEPAATAAPEARTVPTDVSPDGSILAISGYDGLTVAQIRPLLAGLTHTELQAVLEHEVARDNRRTIVADIERRLAQPEPAVETAPEASAATKRTARKAAPTKASARSRKATPKRATAKKAGATKSATKSGGRKASAKKAGAPKAAARRFPISDYDTLGVTQIRPLLASLSKAELEQVRAHEVSGAGRRTILAEIDRRLR